MGYQDEEIPALVKRIINDKVMWKRFMAINELGFDPSQKNYSVVKNALSMWLAYFVGGSVALVSYFFVPINEASFVAVTLVVIGLFALGAIKGRLLKMRWYLSGLEMMMIGLLAAGMGQIVGYLADKFTI